MPGSHEPLEQPAAAEAPRSHRGLVLAAVALACVLALVGVLVAVRRGGGGSQASSTTTQLTFGPEGDATTIADPLPGADPVMRLSLGSGPAGTQVSLQGAGFKGGKGFHAVDLFWDKAGGQQLLSVPGPRFSVKLTIPADAPVLNDGHNIVAVQRTSAGKIVSQTSVPFFVLPARR